MQSRITVSADWEPGLGRDCELNKSVIGVPELDLKKAWPAPRKYSRTRRDSWTLGEER